MDHFPVKEIKREWDEGSGRQRGTPFSDKNRLQEEVVENQEIRKVRTNNNMREMLELRRK